MQEMLKAIIRRLSRFAWDDFLYSVSRVEWKYGRRDDGKAKDWIEWESVRCGLREAGRLRSMNELI